MSTADIELNSPKENESKVITVADKSVHLDGWDPIPREITNNFELPPYSRLLLMYLVSKPEGWTFYDNVLKAYLDCGRDSLETAFRHLRIAGYVTNVIIYDAAGKVKGSRRVFVATKKFVVKNSAKIVSMEKPTESGESLEALKTRAPTNQGPYKPGHISYSDLGSYSDPLEKPTTNQGNTNTRLVGLSDNLKVLTDFGLSESDARWAIGEPEGWVRCVEVMDHVKAKKDVAKPANLFMALMRRKAVVKNAEAPPIANRQFIPEKTYTLEENQGWWGGKSLEEKENLLKRACEVQWTLPQMLEINKVEPMDVAFGNVHPYWLNTIADILGRKKPSKEPQVTFR